MEVSPSPGAMRTRAPLMSVDTGNTETSALLMKEPSPCSTCVVSRKMCTSAEVTGARAYLCLACMVQAAAPPGTHKQVTVHNKH